MQEKCNNMATEVIPRGQLPVSWLMVACMMTRAQTYAIINRFTGKVHDICRRGSEAFDHASQTAAIVQL